MVTEIHHTSFTVSDMERSISFYKDILGMEMVWDSYREGIPINGPVADNLTECPGADLRIVFISGGGGLIELIQYTPPGKPQGDDKAGDTGNVHVAFRIADMQSFYQKLLASGTRVHCEPQNVGTGKVIYFRDPDGIVLEAVEGKLILEE